MTPGWWTRIEANWVYGGVLAGLMLLGLAPVLTAGWSRPETLAFLVLPIYMIHQFEEHDADRFRRFVNTVVAGGREALSVAAVFWINILGVWAVLGVVIWLVRGVSPGWGALAAWLVLVNGLLHVAQAVALRRYNPGVVTGALLFLPLGVITLTACWPLASLGQQLVSFAVAVAIHAAILVHVRRAMKHAPLGAEIRSNGG